MSRWTQADVDAIQAKSVQKRIATQAGLKYGNKRTNGYASKREAKRAEELKLLEKAHQIHDLKEQVKFELLPKQDGERAIYYIADFTYVTGPGGNLVVEDAKGYRDPVYRIKRKLMLHVHSIRIREV